MSRSIEILKEIFGLSLDFILVLIDSMFSVFNILTRLFLSYFYRSLSENRIHSLPPGIFGNLTQLKEL